jgi:hypothetical protein
MTRIVMKDGRVFEDVTIDGGGAMVTGPMAGRRELHGTLPDGEFFCEYEDEIESQEEEE